MLEQDGFKTGRDRVHRLWQLHGLKVPRRTIRRRRLGNAANGITRHEATSIDQVWTYDFVKDQTIDGRSLKILTVVDEHTRESLAVEVERSFTSGAVVRVLERLCRERGKPAHIRSDNGPEFIAHAGGVGWSGTRLERCTSSRARIGRTGWGVSFNGKLRGERLNLELFPSLKRQGDDREQSGALQRAASAQFAGLPGPRQGSRPRAVGRLRDGAPPSPSPDGTRDEVGLRWHR